MLEAIAKAGAWAVSQEVTGFLQWLGTLIAIVGIPLTYRQSWKAAVSADEAARAVRIYSQKHRAATVAHSYSHLGIAQSLVMSSNFAAAVSVMAIIKRDVMQTVDFFNTAAGPPPLNISIARRNISVIEVQLAKAARVDTTFNSIALDKALSGLGSCLIDWETRFLTTKDINNALSK